MKRNKKDAGSGSVHFVFELAAFNEAILIINARLVTGKMLAGGNRYLRNVHFIKQKKFT